MKALLPKAENGGRGEKGRKQNKEKLVSNVNVIFM